MNQGWDIYILTSSQTDSDPELSYFFLYNKQQVLLDQVNDYETGIVEPLSNQALNCLPEVEKHGYHIHWVAEYSY